MPSTASARLLTLDAPPAHQTGSAQGPFSRTTSAITAINTVSLTLVVPAAQKAKAKVGWVVAGYVVSGPGIEPGTTATAATGVTGATMTLSQATTAAIPAGTTLGFDPLTTAIVLVKPSHNTSIRLGQAVNGPGVASGSVVTAYTRGGSVHQFDRAMGATAAASGAWVLELADSTDVMVGQTLKAVAGVAQGTKVAQVALTRFVTQKMFSNFALM